MFWLAWAFLAGVAALIVLLRAAEGEWDWPPLLIVLGGLLLLWPIFLIEAGLRYYLGREQRGGWKPLLRCLGVGLLPPLRLAAHSRTRPGRMWLPWVGWQKIDFDLQKTLEQKFSGPMVFMALLILPVLAVEYFWADAVEAYPLLQTTLGISVGVIWLAFATELIIRMSAADSKLSYAFNQWVDLAVVLLPMLQFMPFLRLLRATRVMRAGRLTRLAKYYRLYGLAGKGWRGLVVLQMIRRMFSRSAQARLERLETQLEEKEDEMRDLEREADYFRRRIEKVKEEIAESQETPETEQESEQSEQPDTASIFPTRSQPNGPKTN